MQKLNETKANAAHISCRDICSTYIQDMSIFLLTYKCKYLQGIYMSDLNPFDYPDQPFDVSQWLDPEVNPLHDWERMETQVRAFFRQQVAQEPTYKLKVYRIIQPYPKTELELIHAYNQSQASYLYLLYQSRCPNQYPFMDQLSQCCDLGPLTPYDIYVLSVHNIFASEDDQHPYLVEYEQVILLYPSFSISPANKND